MKAKHKSRNKVAKKLFSLHQTHSRIAKTDPERNLHQVCASAYENCLETNANPTNELVSASLEALSKCLLEQQDELEKREARINELETALWEGRYCDYIANVLATVKSSAAWQDPTNKHRAENWLQIRTYLFMESEYDLIYSYLVAAAEETGVSCRAIETWIGVYAGRCASKYYHSQFDYLFQNGDAEGTADQILTDLADLFKATPTHLHYSIPHVTVAIKRFQDCIFKKCVRGSGYELTNYGKKIFEREI